MFYYKNHVQKGTIWHKFAPLEHAEKMGKNKS
jgi:hypothetical protein